MPRSNVLVLRNILLLIQLPAESSSTIAYVHISSFKTYTINWSERRIIKFMDSSILVRGIYNPDEDLLFFPYNNNRVPIPRFVRIFPRGFFPGRKRFPCKKRKQIMPIKVYVAEAEGIPEYGTTTTLGKRLVAVKFLLPEASEKEK